MAVADRAGRLVLAADTGATKTLVTVRAAAALHDATAASLRFPTPRDPAAAIAAIAEAATTLAARLPGRLVAGAVVAPGPLDAATGRILAGANLGWYDVPFAGEIADRLAIPVALEDDATAAAIGEALAGAGRGADPFVYLTVSSGVGAGVVSDGRSMRGAHGLAGEIGHLVIDPSGPRCACGRRGDVEAFAGGAALARRARAAWPASRLPDGRPAPRDAAGLFRLAREGDPAARAIANEAALALSHAIGALAAVVDPACIAVGGSIGLGQRGLIRRAVAIARHRTLAATGGALRVVPASLGDRSCVEGAAILATRLIER